HLAAGRAIDKIVQLAFVEVGRSIPTDEYAIQQFILEKFEAAELTTEEPPIVAVNQNSGNPHYEPRRGDAAAIRAGDFVLLDVWGKLKHAGAVYYDVTWVGFVGRTASDTAPPESIVKIFDIVREARDTGVRLVADAIKARRTIHGWEVDQAVRGVI